MPYKKPGTWEGKPHFRWVKMVKGERIRIRCADDLHLPEEDWTEERSIKAAQEFLKQKLGEQPAKVERLAERLADIDSGMAEVVVKKIIDDFKQQAIDRLDAENPEFMADYSHLMIEKLNERFDKIKGKVGNAEKVETTFTLKHHADRFLQIELAKKNRPRTYGELSESINAMIETDGLLPSMDVRSIDKTTVENFYLFLRHSGRAVGQQKKQWGFFKRLVRFLWERDVIDLPKNLESNSFVFKVTATKIKRYDISHVKAALETLPERLKLYALLAANCGMLSVDIGNLLKSDVDLEQGRIKRKRVKTMDEKEVPEVDYKLWPQTLKLLRKHISTDKTLALTSKTGTTLWKHWIGEDGKEHEKNLITLQWKKAFPTVKGQKPKDAIPLKAFRSIGATIIGDHEHYGRYRGHYLGHSPKSIADKHYTPPSPELFDKIMEYVGKELGLLSI